MVKIAFSCDLLKEARTRIKSADSVEYAFLWAFVSKMEDLNFLIPQKSWTWH